MKSSFGVDKLRSKNVMSSVVLTDLTTREGEQLLMNWLHMPNVVGIFLAPPCGSASRARQIPLKRKFGRRNSGPRPLRSDQFPNGIPNLSPSELNRVSLANKLYHLTAKLVKWESENGCIFVVENPQFSLFWATSFWTEVAHLAMYSIFHSCQYGGKRKKKTMLAFNVPDFSVISATCPGQSAKHKHAKWGLRHNSGFATAEETAYPMGLAKLIAVVFARVLLRCKVFHLCPIPWNKYKNVLCNHYKECALLLASKHDPRKYHHLCVHTNIVSKSKDRKPDCRSLQFSNAQKLMYLFQTIQYKHCQKVRDCWPSNTSPP